ncbi:Spo0B domain-containing protein [Paenibacillus selenitireducens]|uniref:Spo0B domain-containing protein n=1 Tax=Paenibacillus selenitireducens TaxID=1324314 RepID=UPI001E61658E|nr:Spo0B domain-containing protein [Paenibacillus selenitireducens]
MKYGRTLRIAAMSSLVIPLLIVILFQQIWAWMIALLVLWIIAVGCVTEWSIRTSRTAILQTEQLKAIRILNHHRHDWMNDLQIISGYIQLKKHDKLVNSVERIRDRMFAESKIAKLGIPSLVMFFQSFRTVCNEIQLDINIVDELNLAELPLAIPLETLSAQVQDMVWTYVEHAEQGLGEPQVLYIAFENYQQELCVRFHYEGEIRSDSDWSSKVKSALQGQFVRVEQEQVPGSLHMYVSCTA